MSKNSGQNDDFSDFEDYDDYENDSCGDFDSKEFFTDIRVSQNNAVNNVMNFMYF